MGCCALEFLHTIEINQGLLTHTRRGTGARPPKKSWKLQIWIKIQRASVHYFRDSGSILTKLFHATYHYCERNFVFLNWFCTRTCGAGRPQAGLCHAHLVSFFSPRFLRDPSTDRPETLPHNQNLAVFYKLTSKIRGVLPQKNLGAKTSKISINFGLLPTMTANISGTRQHIQNR